MTDASTSVPPPAHSFRPQSAEALWRQISTPHPTVGKARHLGEALVHAGLLSTPDLAQGLQAQQEERGNSVQRPIGQILVDRGALTQDQLRNVIATWLGEYTVHPDDITPEASASTMRWTTTAIRTPRGSVSRRMRYATARSENSDAQHRRTRSSTASAPMTFR